MSKRPSEGAEEIRAGSVMIKTYDLHKLSKILKIETYNALYEQPFSNSLNKKKHEVFSNIICPYIDYVLKDEKLQVMEHVAKCYKQDRAIVEDMIDAASQVLENYSLSTYDVGGKYLNRQRLISSITKQTMYELADNKSLIREIKPTLTKFIQGYLERTFSQRGSDIKQMMEEYNDTIDAYYLSFDVWFVVVNDVLDNHGHTPKDEGYSSYFKAIQQITSQALAKLTTDVQLSSIDQHILKKYIKQYMYCYTTDNPAHSLMQLRQQYRSGSPLGLQVSFDELRQVTGKIFHYSELYLQNLGKNYRNICCFSTEEMQLYAELGEHTQKLMEQRAVAKSRCACALM